MPNVGTSSAAEPLIVTPLDQAGNPQNTYAISLQSWALPAPKPTFVTKQRTKKTEYQGNPVATIQKLGPSFDMTTFEFKWHHRHTVVFQGGQPTNSIRLGGGLVEAKDYAPNFQLPLTQLAANFLAGQGGPQVYQPAQLQPLTMGSHPALTTDPTAPELLQEFFEQLCASGRECTVTWARKTRQGVLKEVHVMPERRQDMDCKLTFEWLADLAFPTKPSAMMSSPPLDAATTMAMHAANLAAIVAPLGAPGALTTTMGSILGKFQNQVGILTTAINSVGNLALDYTDMAQHSLAALNSLTQLSASALGVLSYARADSTSANNLATNLVAYEVYRRSLEFEYRSSVGDAYRLAQSFANSVNPQLVTAWRAQQQVDMRDVSVRFYNTPKNWRALCDYNSIQGSQVPPGTLLLIPAL